MVSEALIAARGITKSFPAVRANDHVDFDVRAGEVHALLGENGAGKSTLVKILYGYYRPDAGEIHVRGQPAEIRSPHDARRLGIGMVFQSFTVIPALSVVENIALFLPDLPAGLDLRRIAHRIEEAATRYGLTVDLWAPMRQLSVGEQQKVEVLKLLLAGARVLIFDEPTRVLAPHEIDALMQVLTNLRRDGFAIVFITHKLHEALTCADRITVMRQGRVAGTLARREATEETLLALMFGTAQPARMRRRGAVRLDTDDPALELRSIDTASVGMAMRLTAISLTVMPGEIIGVAGVSGNGQRELSDAIMGLEPIVRGRKFLAGHDATRWPAARVRAGGVAFVPEDPWMVMVPSMTVRENMALGATAKYARRGGAAVDWRAVEDDLARSSSDLAVSTPPTTVPAGSLSGGTVQRLLLARELAHAPRLIIAAYPTRGLDVASATAARDLLTAARNRGAGVLLISEDLSELFALSDRLVVLYRGSIVGTFRPQEATPYDVGRLMTGVGDGHGTDS